MSSGIGDVDFTNGDVRVFTRGIRDSVKALEAAGVEVQDMKSVFERAGMVVYNATVVPERTGKLAGSLKLSKAKNKSVIRVGGARVPYAVANHYGRYFPNGTRVPGTLFMKKALDANREEVTKIVVEGLEDLFRKHDLGDPPIKVTSYVPK